MSDVSATMLRIGCVRLFESLLLRISNRAGTRRKQQDFRRGSLSGLGKMGRGSGLDPLSVPLTNSLERLERRYLNIVMRETGKKVLDSSD